MEKSSQPLKPHLALYMAPVLKDLPLSWTNALSEVENKKIGRYYFEKDQLSSRFAHSFKRQILARHLYMPAKSIEIEIDGKNRPWLSSPSPEKLDFNLSHSANWVIVAVMENASAVGVDVEKCKQLDDFLSLGQRVFHDRENSKLRELSGAAQRQYFYRLWTAKEAISKSTGQGMAIGFNKIYLDVSETETTVQELPGDSSNWQLNGFDLNGEFSVSVAHQLPEIIDSLYVFCPDKYRNQIRNEFGANTPKIQSIEKAGFNEVDWSTNVS